MGLLTFSLNLTLDGCVDHEEEEAPPAMREWAVELEAKPRRARDAPARGLRGGASRRALDSQLPNASR